MRAPSPQPGIQTNAVLDRDADQQFARDAFAEGREHVLARHAARKLLEPIRLAAGVGRPVEDVGVQDIEECLTADRRRVAVERTEFVREQEAVRDPCEIALVVVELARPIG